MVSRVKGSLAFSIDLHSRDQIGRILLPDGSGDRLTIDGFLGKLEKVEIIEDIMLEIRGARGIIRIEISREHIGKSLRRKQ